MDKELPELVAIDKIDEYKALKIKKNVQKFIYEFHNKVNSTLEKDAKTLDQVFQELDIHEKCDCFQCYLAASNKNV